MGKNFVLGCVLFFFAVMCHAKEEPKATITISVLLLNGEMIDWAHITLTAVDGEKDFSRYILRGADHYIATNIPYGEYNVDVAAGGCRPHHQLLHVYQPRVSIRVFLRTARITDETPREIHGIISPAPAKGDKLWIRVFPLLSEADVCETEVQPDGHFQFTGIDFTDYILVVMIRASEALRALLARSSQRLLSSRLPATAACPRAGYFPDSWNPLPTTACNVHGQ
ncbi:MAG: hypothetical protein H6Q04_1405 [Acidobacteria bacterium]|nr:hypothetical protein [Acidobacteriota bacterium]